ncbi:MAG TPA: hypothetical protein VM865_01220 [Acidobacteriaceae bacterium]|jgi:hypothetical protein|nr:hypothetical protein [Acidobacteriaceae bacterium]
MTPPPPLGWIATQATVTTCRYQFARLNTLYLGFQTRDKFRITFDYYAHGRLYSGEFQSPKAIPQNSSVAVHYNPLNPAENTLAPGDGQPTSRTPLFLVGIAGSVSLSLLWFAVLRGCH